MNQKQRKRKLKAARHHQIAPKERMKRNKLKQKSYNEEVSLALFGIPRGTDTPFTKPRSVNSEKDVLSKFGWLHAFFIKLLGHFKNGN